MIHADILVTSQIKILFLLKKKQQFIDHFQLNWLEAISSVFPRCHHFVSMLKIFNSLIGVNI